MHKTIAVLTTVFGIGVVVCSNAKAAPAEDFCAVTLHVTSFDSGPITSLWVEILDSSANVVRREQMHGATFQICDFGFGPHTIRVGTNECLPVSISNVRLVFGSPLSLSVFLNSCGYRDTMRNACFAYLRVTDEHGSRYPERRFRQDSRCKLHKQMPMAVIKVCLTAAMMLPSPPQVLRQQRHTSNVRLRKKSTRWLS